MRLITRRQIYRAFPELDRFDDERCIRFVRAANRGRWRLARRAWIGIAAVAGFFAVMGAVAAVLWAMDRELDSIKGDLRFYSLMAGLVILHFTVAAAAGLVTRDILLRRRIRKVIRDRGVCLGCRYSLVGLSVDPAHRVTCPECGMVTEVDPSLGELASGEDGRALFQPVPDLLQLKPRWLTPVRVKKIKRAAIVAAIGIPLLFGLLAVGYEMFLRWQAGVAARERLGPEGLRAYAAKAALGAGSSMPVSTAGTGSTPSGKTATERHASAAPASSTEDAWRLFDWLEAERREIDAVTKLPDDGSVGASRFWPEYAWVGSELPPPSDQYPGFEKHREAALIMLKAYRDAGWLERSDSITSAVSAEWRPDYSRDQSPVGLLLPELGTARNWARIQSGRMILAREADDPAEFARALETTFTLAWMMKRRPLMICRAVGDAVEALAMGRARDVLTRQPDERWLNAIEGVLDRRRPDPSMEFTLGGEELFVLDSVGWLFEDPGRVRLGRFSREAKAMSGNEYSLALGTYAQNRDAVKKLFEARRQRLGLPLPELEGAVSIKSNLIMPNAMMGGMTGMAPLGISIEHLLRLETAGARAMIALERFRIEHGVYPQTLASLVPAHLAEIPIDPWSGNPLGYRLVDPAADRQGRGYLLYSIGADKEDNNGTQRPMLWSQPFHAANPGADLIVNDRER